MSFAVLPRRDTNPEIERIRDSPTTMATPQSRLARPLLDELGVEVRDAARGVIDVPVIDWSRNSMGAMQGGVVATVAEVAAETGTARGDGRAARRQRPPGDVPRLRPGRAGPVRRRRARHRRRSRLRARRARRRRRGEQADDRRARGRDPGARVIGDRRSGDRGATSGATWASRCARPNDAPPRRARGRSRRTCAVRPAASAPARSSRCSTTSAASAAAWPRSPTVGSCRRTSPRASSRSRTSVRCASTPACCAAAATTSSPRCRSATKARRRAGRERRAHLRDPRPRERPAAVEPSARPRHRREGCPRRGDRCRRATFDRARDRHKHIVTASYCSG